MSNNLRIGHLGKADAAKINDVPIVEGQIIYSEGHEVQFVDFSEKRHSYGDIISGVYNDKYVDFNDNISWEGILNAIIINGNVKDNQKIKIANNIMTYRVIGNNHFLTIGDDINPGAVPFIINYGGNYDISHQTTILLMDILLKQLYCLTIDVASDGTIQASCEDFNGVIADISSVVSVSITGQLLQITPTGSHVFDVISYSDSNILSLTGFYSIIDDLA